MFIYEVGVMTNINKTDEILDFIRTSRLFKSFCDNLPCDANPKNMQIKVTYKPKPTEEKV